MLEELSWKLSLHHYMGGQADIKIEMTWDSTLPIDRWSFVKIIWDFMPQIDRQSHCVLNQIIKRMRWINSQKTKEEKKKNDMSQICHHHTKTSVVPGEFVNCMSLAIPCVVVVPRPGWSQNERKNTLAKGRQQVDQPPIHNNQQKSEAPAVVIRVAKTSIRSNLNTQWKNKHNYQRWT